MCRKHQTKQAVKRPPRFENGLIFIPLSNGTEAFVDDTEDTRRIVLGHNWSASSGYAVRKINGKANKLHRLLLPAAGFVDHINGNILDNRLCNLREATPAQNRMNSKPNKGKRLKGVRLQYRSYDRKYTGKWLAYIGINRKLHYLGTFDTEEAAHEAWMARAIERDPDFARGR